MNMLLSLSLCSFWISLVFGQELEAIWKWNYIDFDWLSEKQRIQFINEGKYNKISSVPIGVQICGPSKFIHPLRKGLSHFTEHSKVFVSIPRADGVPASLVTLNMAKQAGGGPVGTPYPDWSWTGRKCNESIISVYRVACDRCGRLWVLDNGQFGEDQVCPPKILAFDTKTNKLLIRKEIPNEYAFNKKGKGLLVTPLVKTCGKNCKDVTVYLADITGYGLIVWDGKDKFKRFESDVFSAPNPNFTLNNESFYLDDGIVGMALVEAGNKENLYFSALASTAMYHVSTREITVNSNESPNYIEDTGDLGTRRVALVSEDTAIYFASLEDNALEAWDTRGKFNRRNVKTLAKSDIMLQFVSDIKINNFPDTYIYGMSNKYQKTAAGTRNINETNFYVFKYRKEPANF